jgi:hypothetical protein
MDGKLQPVIDALVAHYRSSGSGNGGSGKPAAE